MNIKKMMAALACAAAVGFSAQAADWFNSGIEAGWPNKATDATWSGAIDTGLSEYDATAGRVNIKFGEGEAKKLTCTARYAKTPGNDVDSVTFESKVGFSAYEAGSCPAVEDGAKAAITFIATDDNETTGEFYYWAYDSVGGSNKWVASGITRSITDNFGYGEVAVTVGVKSDDKWAVKYWLGSGDEISVTVAATDAAVNVHSMEFAGNGPGWVSAMRGTYAAKTVAITDGLTPADNMTCTNVMYKGELYGFPCKLPAGATDVTFYFQATDDYKFTGANTSTVAGPINADFEVNSTTVALPEIKPATVEMMFYDAGTNDLAGPYVGMPGDDFTNSTEVLTAAASLEAQIVGTWWNGTWVDGEEEAIAFPVKFPTADGTYKMACTNIEYRVATEGGDTDVVIVKDQETGEESFEGYTIVEADEICGKLVFPSYDPIEPTEKGRKFLGWTCEYFGLTTPTMSVDIKQDERCRMPDDFESWDNVGDIIFVANWSVAKIVDEEEKETHYATFEEAIKAAQKIEDAVVEIIDDCTVTGQVKVTKGTFTIENNCTVSFADLSGKGDYNFYIDDANVTFDGEGTWVKASSTGGGSMITCGRTAAPTITIAGGNFIGGTEGMTTLEKGPSNLIQMKNGTITVNGGTFKNYRCDANEGRCIRVDAATAVANINAGEFSVANAATDPKGLPVAKSDKGDGTINIKTDAGDDLKFNKDMSIYCPAGYKTKLAEGWYTVVAIDYAELTITQVENCTIVVSNATAAVESGAKFDKDDAVQLTVYRAAAEGYVLDGYEAVEVITMSEDQEVTAAVKASAKPEPVAPGGEIVVPTGKTTEEFAEDITTNVTLKAQYLKAPEGAETTGTYLDLFKAVPAGEGKVTFTLSEEGEEVLQTAADVSVAAALDDGTIATIPGLYYTYVGGTEVGTIATSGDKTLATSAETTVPKPELGTTDKAFYQLKIEVK